MTFWAKALVNIGSYTPALKRGVIHIFSVTLFNAFLRRAIF